MGLTIIGKGEVAQVFARAARTVPRDVRLVVRGEDPVKSALVDGPIVAAVREEDLVGLVPQLSGVADRCVFVQNGFLDEILAPLRWRSTEGLLWFTAKKGFFRVLRPSIFFGPSAAALVELLRAGGIDAAVAADRGDYLRASAVKLAWNNVVGLPLAVRGATLGEYLVRYAEEARAIVEETAAVLSAQWAVPVDAEEAFRTLLETTRELSWLKGGAKALAFRNGAIVRLGALHHIPTPVNASLAE